MEPQTVNPKASEQPQKLQPIQSAPASTPSSFGGRLKVFFKNPKKVIVVVAAAIFLISGAAAAYFSNYLPNKPENRLVAALANAGNEDKVTIEGTAKGQYSQAGSSSDYDASYNLIFDHNNLALRIESQLGGSKYSAEARFIGSDLFFKVSGLSADVLQQLYPSANTPLLTEIFKAVEGINDQWYKLDQTPTEGELNCLNSTNLKLNDKDKQIVEQAFKKSPPLIIQNTSQATVNGQPATKFRVTTADGKTLRGFVDGVASTSFLQTINKCDTTGKSSPESLRNEIDESQRPSAPFNIYIDSDNKIKKMEFDFGGQEGQAKVTADFKWGVGTVSQPADAKSVQELINEILGGDSLFGDFDQQILPDAILEN